jgi:hypothetical protein
MKKLFYLPLMCSLAVAIFLVGCQKEATESTKTVEAVASVRLENAHEQDGMLVFNTKADFEKALKVIEDNQGTALIWLKKQFPNFVSSEEAFSALTDADYDRIFSDAVTPEQYASFVMRVTKNQEHYVEPVVGGIILRYLVNKQGLIAYGEQIAKINHNDMIEFNKSELATYLATKKVDDLAGLKKYTVKHSIVYENDRPASSVSPRWNVDWFDMFPSFSSNKKFSGVISKVTYPFSIYMDATSKYQQKINSTWRGDQAEQLTLGGSITIGINGVPHVIDVTMTKDHTGSITKGWSFGYGFNDQLGSSWSTTHTCKIYSFAPILSGNLIR